jgi:chorismate synthase
MNGNVFGKIFQISTFGESHGPGIGLIINGMPAGISINFEMISRDLARRKPGQSHITTSRNEDEEYEILSGVFEGKTIGTPITFLVRNKDSKSEDYNHLKETFRPGHADFTYHMKYGIRDYRGGGRSSARETLARVIGGSFAKMILEPMGIRIISYVSEIGHLKILEEGIILNQDLIDSNPVKCPDPILAKSMEFYIETIKNEGDSIGGVISTLATGIPAGWGEPVFDKLHAELGKAILSINACKGFEIGDGFSSTKLKGSEMNDIIEFFPTKDGNKQQEQSKVTPSENGGDPKIFHVDNPIEPKNFTTQSNHSGGIQGGISNGQPVFFRAAFKPVSTILKSQKSVDSKGQEIVLEGKGRHDPCVLPRAVPIVEAMTALVLVDMMFRNQNIRKNG